MITIINNHSIKRINDFVASHNSILDGYDIRLEPCDISNVTPNVATCLGTFLLDSDDLNSPYSIFPNTLLNTGVDYFIIESDNIIQEWNLDDNECKALIAHELGHVHSQLSRIKDDEYEADSFSVQLGYKLYLKSGLHKIFDSIQCDEHIKEELAGRIALLSGKEDIDIV